MSKGSDINVGSIEEAIKQLEDLKLDRLSFVIGDKEHDKIYLKDIQAIEIVLGNLEALCDMQRAADRELKRQKQINEEHQKENDLLRKKIKVLEAKNKYLESLSDCQNSYLIDSIPKQKIKDKFEEIQLLYEKNLKEVNLKEVEKIDGKIFEGIGLEAQRELTRELLKEENQ